VRDALDPDHWVNGGECDHPHPDALAMEALDAEIERLRQALHDARIENSGQAAEIERLNEAKRWIPVLDRVPELGVDVLVLQRIGQCEVAWRHVVDGNWMSYAALGEITHWMPLPELPKQRWIPVDERLPETRDPVLTLWVSGMQSVKQYDEQHGWNTGAQVTHWMLLPELPKKEVQG